MASHGAGFEATLWGSPATQSLRFEVLCGFIGDVAGASLIDLGCGDGALADFLDDRVTRPVHYLGFDAIEEQIARASACGPDWARFERLDITTPWTRPCDWVVCSGALNTMDERLAREVIEHAWSQCVHGTAFNFLSNRASPAWLARDTGPARRFDTLDWVGWAMSQTPRVAMRQDYLDGHDVTIAMYRAHA